MSLKLNFTNASSLRDATLDVRLSSRKSYSLPSEVQARVDSAWDNFSSANPNAKKGEAAVLKGYSVLENGLRGEASIATFDRVLYFARQFTGVEGVTNIPEDDYRIGRENVGFPLASWALLESRDGNVLFMRKKGKEGAYEGQPFSGFGGLVNANKDFTGERFDPKKWLERTVGGEVGGKIWTSRTPEQAIVHGLNIYDANTNGVNNGYDIVLSVPSAMSGELILENLKVNPQFVEGSGELVEVSPKALRKFVRNECDFTASGISGLLTFAASKFGREEAERIKSEYPNKKGFDIAFA